MLLRKKKVPSKTEPRNSIELPKEYNGKTVESYIWGFGIPTDSACRACGGVILERINQQDDITQERYTPIGWTSYTGEASYFCRECHLVYLFPPSPLLHDLLEEEPVHRKGKSPKGYRGQSPNDRSTGLESGE